ncbi:MAG TPA: helix-turn-helix transcriptional regulator [Pilimelia sp.]|nr:helix-turn-helix transcriptional regulator [Pilimelia sp.]
MAVLALLRDRPRHPYEMQTLLRERHVGAVVKLRGGSVYDAIDRSVRAGLIEPVDRNRSGARPERTVYTLTAAGESALRTLVRRYVGAVVPEFPVFPAGLAHLLILDREEAIGLLRERRRSLAGLAEEADDLLAEAGRAGVPRVVLLETEYAQLLRYAEIEWLQHVTEAIESGALPWFTAATTDAATTDAATTDAATTDAATTD